MQQVVQTAAEKTQPVKEKVPLDPAPILKKFSMGGKEKTLNTILLSLGAILVVLAGVATGWFLSGSTFARKSEAPQGQAAPGAKQGVKEAGLADEETFRDTAEGVIEEGGIDGEGTHHLVRDGGDDQNVYLTSTVIDLSSFKGKKVQVWGETIAAQTAGWLMDVGKVKVIE